LLNEDVKLASPAGVGLLFVFATFCYVAHVLAYALYNVYLHPLSKFPGPKSWIAFPILRHIAAARGLLDERIREFYAQYGEVVRYTSLEVSFITADAWKDIYGHGHTPKMDLPQTTWRCRQKTRNGQKHPRRKRCRSRTVPQVTFTRVLRKSPLRPGTAHEGLHRPHD
jgi:hypothetical protein